MKSPQKIWEIWGGNWQQYLSLYDSKDVQFNQENFGSNSKKIGVSCDSRIIVKKISATYDENLQQYRNEFFFFLDFRIGTTKLQQQ